MIPIGWPEGEQGTMVCPEFQLRNERGATTAGTVSRARSFSWRAVLLAFCAFVTIVGSVVPEVHAAGFIERAQEYLEAGDLRSANIELKNALQRDPNNAEARFLLGTVHLGLGDLASAEKELLKARELGYSDKELDLALARTRLELRRFEDVISSIPEDVTIDTPLQAALFVARGEALLNLGQFDEAEAIFDRVLRDGPHARALTNKARMAMILDDMAGARAYLDQAAAADPDDPLEVVTDAAWLFREKRFEDAKLRFARAIELEPSKVAHRLAKVQTHLALGELDEAGEILDYLKSAGADSALLKLQESIVHFLRADYRRAKATADEVLAVAQNQRQALLVAGYSAFQLGSFEQARAHLSAYLSRSPQDSQARMVLGAAMLRLGKSEEAYSTVKVPEASLSENAAYLGVLTDAAFAAGDRDAGLKYLERLAVRLSDNAVVQEKLGIARAASGDIEGGVEAFERSVALKPDRLEPYTWLFRIHLQQEQTEQARQLAQTVRSTFPALGAGDTMLGFLHLSKGETGEAEAAFRRAVDREPSNSEAANNLASILYSEGELGEARAVLQGVLDRDPSQLRSLLASAEIERKGGNFRKSEKLLLQAIEHHPQETQARVVLGSQLLEEGRAADALAISEPIVPRNLHVPQLLTVVATARLRTGDAPGAVELFERLVSLDPDSAQSHAMLMQALEQSGRIAEALDAAERTLALEPNAPVPELAKVRYLAHLGRLEEAKQALAELKNRFPDRPEVLTTEGRIALEERRIEDALALFELAYQQQPDNVRLLDLARLGVVLGEKDKYVPLMFSWLQENPEDLLVRATLSDLLIALGRYAEARQQYELILARTPSNARILNNLAWVQVELGEPKVAVATARKAVKLAPQVASYSDTLGMALLESGEYREALALIREAHKHDPENPDIRFHLARAFVKNGDTTNAVRTLQSLLESNVPFGERSQAQALLDSLGR